MVLSGDGGPAFNMGLDYAFWQSVKQRRSPPTLRFYQWKPASVSIGYRQSPEKLVNVSFCHSVGIPIVSRPTGGSALFHDLEIPYSFTAGQTDHSCFASPLSSYLAICAGLSTGLKLLGINAEVRGYSSSEEPTFSQKDCFSLSSRHDLVVKGKKIVGSAQKRDRFSFLQHGAILLAIRKEWWQKIFIQKVDFSAITCVSDHISSTPEPKVILDCLVRGFSQVFQKKFLVLSPTEEEIQQAKHYASTFFRCLNLS
ncbi:MAG: lipoate--protein ligase family protein [Candidatus Omnitrophica bacterium]|nr:lipoate--protein ligase family protein [Candidatus Omnitrophota bacterium]